MTDYTELKRLAEAATQGEWQVIETELPCRIGRPHVERRIFTAKDHPQLKAPYPVVNGSVALGTDETPVHHMVSMTAEDAAFIAAANPAAVLALIAENERLREANDKFARRNGMLEENVNALTASHVRYTWLRKKVYQPGNDLVAVTQNIGHDWAVVHDLDCAVDHMMEGEQP